MKILYIINGLGFSSGMPPGGADKRAVEIGRRLKGQGAQVFVLTSDAGKKILEKEDFEANYITFKRPAWWPDFLENNLIGRMLAYFWLVFDQFLHKNKIIKQLEVDGGEKVVVYPTSDMFFDIIPAAFLGKKVEGSKFVGIVHHWIPKNRPGSKLKNTLLYLYQRFGFWIYKKKADLILVPQNPEGEKISRDLVIFGVGEERIGSFRNGANVEEIQKVPQQKKEFAACFLGSIRPSKGIFDIVPIWQKVLGRIPEARLLIIGGGLDQYINQLKREVSQAGLEKKIIFAGVVPQEDLFSKVKSAKVFISPSHEEGWGIVVSEALAAGLPVVATDLPAFKVYGDAITTVPLGDLGAFAQEVIRLLKSEELLEKKSTQSSQVAHQFSWRTAAEKELSLLQNL